MNKAQAAANLGITGFFLFNIIRHMIRPGENTTYTSMLMFVCLGTIPMAFMMGVLGGRDRWPFLVDYAREIAANKPYPLLIMAGLGVLMIVLPMVIFLAAWAMMELRSGLLFILYFVPLFMRMALESSKACIHTAALHIALFFISVFVGLGIIAILERYASGAGTYEAHVRKIWPGYGTAARMFFWVCSFTLLNQLIEFGRALRALVK